MTLIPRGNKTRVKLTPVILAIFLFGLAACGAGNSRDVPADQSLQPSAARTGWAKSDVKGVTISVPTTWQKTGPITPGSGAELFTFQTERNTFGTRGGAQLLTLDTYTHKAADLVANITSEAQAVAGAKEITSTQIIWPGADDAWLITYVAYPSSNGKVAAHPTEVLVLDLPGGGQAQATVTALKENFGSEHMHDVLETVRITKTAGSKMS